MDDGSKVQLWPGAWKMLRDSISAVCGILDFVVICKSGPRSHYRKLRKRRWLLRWRHATCHRGRWTNERRHTRAEKRMVREILGRHQVETRIDTECLGLPPKQGKVEDGELCERHEDQLRHQSEGQPPTPQDGEGKELSSPTTANADPLGSFLGPSPIPSNFEEQQIGNATSGVTEERDTCSDNNGAPAKPLRRSLRSGFAATHSGSMQVQP
ncbi:hypothetical protein HPB52_005628 [Rhipicephalus sanguineus]|uniref:Uncharacterized protein n=1 Tax=Rhipicephalus sanguineus TaxID=34632 RepID=A0A9D4PK38_RHISA|nr:hypothetical protein HPB52_005628 [Rhipicephalus sanguineus]